MSAGVPVVASNRGSLPEVVGSWRNPASKPTDVDGWASAIDRLTSDERGTRPGVRGPRARQGIHLGATAARLAQAYRDAVARRAAPQPDMRIAIDARELAGKPTGVGRYLSEILSAWTKLPRRGRSRVHPLLAREHSHAARWAPLTDFERLSAGGHRALMWEQLVLPRLIKQGTPPMSSSLRHTRRHCPSGPIVLTVHDVSFLAHPEWFSWREGRPPPRDDARPAPRRAARVLTQSDFTKREAVRHLGLDQSRVDVIYLGTTTLLRTAAPSHPRTLALSQREPLVLYVGSLFNRRHVPELIDGFTQLASRHPTARLEIVGDNRTTPAIDVDALIARSGVADRIRARQYVSDAELSDLYARASAFAFLSEYEGFGLTPLEAMAAGIPVVVLDTEVSREIYGPAAEYVAEPEPGLDRGRARTGARQRRGARAAHRGRSGAGRTVLVGRVRAPHTPGAAGVRTMTADMQRPRLSIVIVTYNSRRRDRPRPGSLTRHVAGHLARDRRRRQRLVGRNSRDVRDKWPDGTVDRVRRESGLCRSQQPGIRTSSSELVLLLNPDTRVPARRHRRSRGTARCPRGRGHCSGRESSTARDARSSRSAR